MIAYRDPDFSELETFLKHISIAETLFGTNADLAARLSTVRDPDLEQSYRQTWNDAWEQLAQARTIVVRLGRDPTAIDAERARAGDHNLVAAGLESIKRDMRVAAKSTIIALRRALPEAALAAGPSHRPAIDANPPQITRPNRFFRMTPMVGVRIGVLAIGLMGALIRWGC
jgi:hypothetical protein